MSRSKKNEPLALLIQPSTQLISAFYLMFHYTTLQCSALWTAQRCERKKVVYVQGVLAISQVVAGVPIWNMIKICTDKIVDPFLRRSFYRKLTETQRFLIHRFSKANLQLNVKTFQKVACFFLVAFVPALNSQHKSYKKETHNLLKSL